MRPPSAMACGAPGAVLATAGQGQPLQTWAKASAQTSGVGRFDWNDPVVAVASVIIIGSFFWVPAGAWLIWKRKCTTRRRKALFVAALLLILFAPVPVNRKVARWWLWNRFLRYFNCRAVGVPEASQSKQALFCLVPHGIFPFGVAFGAVSDMNAKYFNEARPVVATAISRMPIIGQILAKLGAVKASPSAVAKAMDEGSSLALAPGGIAEIFWGYPRPGCSPDKEYALLRAHKGFIKRAIEHGVPLVPVYVFGNTDTFRRAPLPAAVERVSRLLKTSLVLFWGRWGLPIPFKVPLMFAFGEPLTVLRDSHPSEETVSAVHRDFCAALVEVFDRHKGLYGWGHKLLEIV